MTLEQAEICLRAFITNSTEQRLRTIDKRDEYIQQRRNRECINEQEVQALNALEVLKQNIKNKRC